MTRNAILLLTVILAALTATALLGAAATLTRPAAEVASSTRAADAADAEVVRRFYVAADRALGTGDTSALRAVVAPGFVEHGAPAAGDASLAAYLRLLGALGAACPDCTLDAEAIVVEDEWAAARVVARGR